MKTEHFAPLVKTSRVLDWISNLIVMLHFGLAKVLFSYSDKAYKLHLFDESHLLFMLAIILGPIQIISFTVLLIFAIEAWYFLLLFLGLVLVTTNAIIKIALKASPHQINPSKDEDSNY